jgi:hypothetical protein
MSNELGIRYTTGETVYAVILDGAQQAWNGAAFEAIADANWGDYDVPLTELGTASGVYAGDAPALPAGLYAVVFFVQAGASPAVGDRDIGTGVLSWDGAAEVTTVDVDSIAGSEDAATNLAALYGSLITGQAVTGTLAADTFTTDLAAAAVDHFVDYFLMFTSGVNAGESRKISAYSGTGTFTITVATAFPAAPSNGDDFVIVGRSE